MPIRSSTVQSAKCVDGSHCGIPYVLYRILMMLPHFEHGCRLRRNACVVSSARGIIRKTRHRLRQLAERRTECDGATRMRVTRSAVAFLRFDHPSRPVEHQPLSLSSADPLCCKLAANAQLWRTTFHVMGVTRQKMNGPFVKHPFRPVAGRSSKRAGKRAGRDLNPDPGPYNRSNTS